MPEEPPPFVNAPSAPPEAAPAQADDPGERLDDVIPLRDRPVQPVIGLGGSAGSLSALRAFFSAMPADGGLAFVVVHLPPDHESHLAALLQGVTSMPVMQVRDALPVEANRVYVIPPAKQLSLSDGQLRLSELEAERSPRVAIDRFFRTLAEAIGPQATAIVLCGTDGDGALGLKKVKERGGLTIAQEPQEAEYDGMPRAAIATGAVDWVLPVADMPGRLLAYYRRGGRLRLPSEEPPPSASAESPDAEAALGDALSLLHARTGHDFSGYKRATVLRRLGRRLQVNGLEDLPAYLQFLRAHPGEAGALLQDLLISVTHFFRDPEAFTALEAQLPRLFAGKRAGDSVRVWVAGCATGEEAYSIALLLAEQAGRLPAPPSIQVFATDLDEAALRIARQGLYPEGIAADLSEERLRGFFVQDHGRYRVSRALRETVLFAAHDLLKDAPFSHLDLVSCRNLLIYLNRAAQHRALELFYFALKPGGLLLLGSAETVEEAGDLFRPLDKKERLYARGVAPRPVVPLLPSDPSSLAQALQPPPARPAAGAPGGAPSWGALHLKLRDAWAPPSALLDPEDRIVHLAERAERYLRLGGEATLELLRVVHPGLRPELRAALCRARQTGGPVQVTGVPVELGGEPHAIDLHVRPAQGLAPGFLLVAFEERPAAPAEAAAAEPRPAAEPLVRQLESELDRLKLQQRATAQEYAASLEELRSSNEELQVINEELRSATEELETGREELQSVNEELSSVNQELKHKVDELDRANSDLQNLMASADIATLFLDRELRIQRYTPAAVRLFNLIPTDLGRPLSDLSHRLENDFVVADAQRVLEALVPVEREQRSREGRWYLARLLPYRNAEDQVAGVVLTFVDITERKAAEGDRARLAAIVESSEDAIIGKSLEGIVTSWNEGARRLFGYTAEEMVGQPVVRLIPPDRLHEEAQILARVRRGERVEPYETVRRRKDGRLVEVSLGISPIRDGSGRIVGAAKVVRDVTERRAAEAALREGEQYMRLAAEAAQLALWSWDIPHDEVWSSELSRARFGFAPSERLSFERGLQALHPEDREAVRQAVARALNGAAGGEYEGEYRVVLPDGQVRWMASRGRVEFQAGTPQRLRGVSLDITRLKQAEERFRLVVEAAPNAMVVADAAGKITLANAQAEAVFGYSRQELVGQPVEMLVPERFRAQHAGERNRYLAEPQGRLMGAGRDLHGRRKDGREVPVEIGLNPLRTPEGLFVLASIVDITERRQAELEAARQRDELAHLSRVLVAGELSGSLAHELNQPLTAVLTNAQAARRLLAQGAAEPGELQDILTDIVEGSHRATEIIRRLRLLLKKGEVQRQPLDVNEVAQNVLKLVRSDLARQRVAVEVDLAQALPVVLGDGVQLQQVLLNLVINGAEAMAGVEGPERRLLVRTESADGPGVWVAVSDQGGGIPPDQLGRLFEPFFTTKAQGIGLGLAVCRTIIAAHGGRLWATNNPGRGATFQFTLPPTGGA